MRVRLVSVKKKLVETIFKVDKKAYQDVSTEDETYVFVAIDKLDLIDQIVRVKMI